MRVLVLGNGGREHAIAWRLHQSPSVKEVVVAPGNPGCAQVATCIRPASTKTADLLALADQIRPDLTIVGPEAPLVNGIVDLFRANGRLIFGPTQAAARLEGSKIFAKEFMVRHRIPTARYSVVSTQEEARPALRSFLESVCRSRGILRCFRCSK